MRNFPDRYSPIESFEDKIRGQALTSPIEEEDEEKLVRVLARRIQEGHAAE